MSSALALIGDPAIDIHMKHGSAVTNMLSTMHLYPINGAAYLVAKTDTAWSYHDTTWAQLIVGVDPDPANKDRIVNWARDYWNALRPYSAAGAYMNFMMDEGEDRIRTAYRENYDRLSAIKAKYDPDNFFRVNQNIKPGSQRKNAGIA
jgi:FAD/FMN-containing dehydrogenase